MVESINTFNNGEGEGELSDLGHLCEVAKLRNLFAPNEKPRKKPAGSKAKPRALKVRTHAYLTAMVLRRIHFFRYGTELPSEYSVMTFK